MKEIAKRASVKPWPESPIEKVLTGIAGFDEISGGGLPRGRLTAVMGSAGAGKTVFALQTMVNRCRALGEPCIFVTFEEPVARIRSNVASFDWDMSAASDRMLHFIDAIVPEDALVSGAFDLGGLLAGLSVLVEETGARHIVFDGIDILLAGLQDERLERRELLRLDHWIRQANVSAIITLKAFGAGDRDQTRADFLQYMTDCLIVLVGTLSATSVSNTLRIVKYRGSGFAANPVPIVIGGSGMHVIAFKGSRIDYPTFRDRLSSGVPQLDALLNGGYMRGSSTLISGSPGTSKTSLAVSFLVAACARGEKAMMVSFDESAEQIISNMNSIGFDLAPLVETGMLTIASFLSSGRSPEEHFVAVWTLLREKRPQHLAVDPISALLKADYPFSAMICENLLDAAKAEGITVLCTSLLGQADGASEMSASHVSTIADTWLHLSNVAKAGERNRALTIIKSRGTGHSNQVRELVLCNSGIDVVDVYFAKGEVLMGSARAQAEAEEERVRVHDEIADKREQLDLERGLSQARMQVEEATQEFEWKQREAEIFREDQKNRLIAERVTAIARVNLRRSANDIGPGNDDAHAPEIPL